MTRIPYLLFPAPACRVRQVTVQESPIPKGLRKGAANSARQNHGRKGEVWTPGSAADKLVVYRYK